MIRIAHISDSHLGCAVFQLEERREDVRRSFKRAVDTALEYRPHILVHTGDLFDINGLNSIKDLTFAIGVFRRVRRKGVIPILVDGNHDVPYGFMYDQSPLRSLEASNVVVGTKGQEYRRVSLSVEHQDVELHLLAWTRQQRARRYLRNAVTESNSDVALFFAHHLDVEYDTIPDTFQYYGFGHKHTFALDTENCVGIPGSTCIVKPENELYGTKRVIIVEIDGDEVKFETPPISDTRRFIQVKLDVTGRSATEIKQEVVDSVMKRKKNANGAIVLVRLTGAVDGEVEGSLKRNEVIQEVEEKTGALLVHLDVRWECYGPRDIRLTRPLDVMHSVREYLEQTRTGEPEQLLERLRRVIEGGGE